MPCAKKSLAMTKGLLISMPEKNTAVAYKFTAYNKRMPKCRSTVDCFNGLIGHSIYQFIIWGGTSAY
jgi:hypothetical protein